MKLKNITFICHACDDEDGSCSPCTFVAATVTPPTHCPFNGADSGLYAPRWEEVQNAA
jgi:hypothetical protein